MSRIRKKCPFCYEKLGSVGSRENISISLEHSTYKCYRCGSYGYLNKDIAYKLGIPYDSNGIVYKQKETLEYSKHKLSRLTSFKNLSPLYTYMRNRGVTDYVLDKFNISVSMNNSMTGVIFPLRDNKKDAFIYRVINGTYINRNINRNIDIYNGCILKDDCEFIFVVEGPIDVLCIYPLPAISTLGKNITRDQHDRIINSGKKIIYMLDSDAFEFVEATILQDMLVGINTYYVRLYSGKDPADYGFDGILDLKIESLSGKVDYGKVRQFIE